MFDAEEEVAEGTVDVFASALNGGVVGRVDLVSFNHNFKQTISEKLDCFIYFFFNL